MSNRMPIAKFVAEIRNACERHDGYIMGATGQDPKKWSVNSWWFTQYKSDRQRRQALHWREHAARVWDCNGLAEGIYKDWSGRDINTRARYNYSGWCGRKDKGLIPACYRVSGAAVFWGKTAASIHHVAYLDRPVNAGNPSGDWYIIEARGVMYGVVRTRLYDRKPNYWGWMDKYFDYSDENGTMVEPAERDLYNGCEGEDVKELQGSLIRLGYDCGGWGADGDFGDSTELALKRFQYDAGIDVDGICGAKTRLALEKAISMMEKPEENYDSVKIVDGNCYIRKEPTTAAAILGVAYRGEVFSYLGETSENGWNKIESKFGEGWVSGKYSKRTKGRKAK